jgi:hypothetical protein
MAASFDRDQLLAALDEIGKAAIAACAHLDTAVYGGSALMLASNFRFSTEDVDISEIGRPWPDWLSAVVNRIASANSWQEEWLNDAVTFHLSPLANPARDLVALGTFPRGSEQGANSIRPNCKIHAGIEAQGCTGGKVCKRNEGSG